MVLPACATSRQPRVEVQKVGCDGTRDQHEIISIISIKMHFKQCRELKECRAYHRSKIIRLLVYELKSLIYATGERRMYEHEVNIIDELNTMPKNSNNFESSNSIQYWR